MADTSTVPPHAAKREPNVGQPKGLGNISDIRCRISRHWFIIAPAGLGSVGSVRGHLCEAVTSAATASVALGCASSRSVCLGPASLLALDGGLTEPAFAVAGCICARPWLPPLLSWSSCSAHPVAGCVWRPPAWGSRQMVGWMWGGKGFGVR